MPLNQLAQLAPDWLKTVVMLSWYERYGRRFDSFHLPDSREKRQALAKQIGADGYWLMAHAFAPMRRHVSALRPASRHCARFGYSNTMWMTAGAETHVILRDGRRSTACRKAALSHPMTWMPAMPGTMTRNGSATEHI